MDTITSDKLLLKTVAENPLFSITLIYLNKPTYWTRGIDFAIQTINTDEQIEYSEIKFFKNIIALGRQMWNIVDVVVGIGFIISIFMKPKGRPRW